MELKRLYNRKGWGVKMTLCGDRVGGVIDILPDGRIVFVNPDNHTAYIAISGEDVANNILPPFITTLRTFTLNNDIIKVFKDWDEGDLLIQDGAEKPRELTVLFRHDELVMCEDNESGDVVASTITKLFNDNYRIYSKEMRHRQEMAAQELAMTMRMFQKAGKGL